MLRQPFKARTSEELIALLSAVATAILAFIIITTLYFGREIFVPIALAILLSFVLAPLVGVLQRIRMPRGLAVVSVVIIAFAMIFAMGSLLATQLTQLAGDLPRYQSTISEKIQSFRETTAGRGTLERASGMLKDLSKELEKPMDAGTGTGSILSPKAPAPLTPVPVEVRQPDPSALESLQSLISPLLHPLATTGIIIIFVIFILLQREDLRNRLIRLAGSHDLASFKRNLRRGHWDRSVAYRHSKCDLVGHLGRSAALRPLHRRGHRCRVPTRARGRRRSQLVHAALDDRTVSCRGAERWACHRANGLRPQHGALPLPWLRPRPFGPHSGVPSASYWPRP